MQFKLIRLVLIACLGLSFPSPTLASDWQKSFIAALKNGGALVETEAGKTLLAHRSEELFIPASILKIAMAACTLDAFNPNAHFYTDFFLNPQGVLGIKGYGDPFLVSEEWMKIAKALKAKGVKTVTGFQIDHSFFADDAVFSQSGASSNPYHAANGALLANFNTVFFEKRANGELRSAEPQTPLTPLVYQIAKGYGLGRQRVNLGSDPKLGVRYAGELLAAFLKQEGLTVLAEIGLAPLGGGFQQIYRHHSTKPMTEVIQEMLKFSTNFIANQLFLSLGAWQAGAPATIEKGQNSLTKCLRQNVGWKDFEVKDGAGLSRHNQVSPQHMMSLLRYFEKYRTLLPVEKGHFQAKTGTLTGVNTLAGYFTDPKGRLIRFVLMVNSPVPFDYKFQLAQRLYQSLTH